MLLDKINKYYDKKEKEINITDDITVEVDGDIVKVYNSKKKIIYEGKYQIVGIFNITNSVWYWGWFIDYANRKLLKQSANVKKKGKELLKNNKIKSRNDESLYYYMTTGHFMTNEPNVNLFIKLMLYITKGKWFFNIKTKENNNIINEYIMIY